jgi:hypothetical protein
MHQKAAREKRLVELASVKAVLGRRSVILERG